jgi:hypothetical protein
MNLELRVNHFNKFSTIFLVLFSLFLFSCEKEVKLDIPGFEEQLVIDGSIETNQAPIVILSSSKNIYAKTDLSAFLSSFISGATVTVSDGTNTVVLDEICSDNLPPGTEGYFAEFFGVTVSEISNYKLCVYTTFNPQMFGKTGKTYNLNITYKEKTYTASSQLLSPSYFDKTFWKAEKDLPDYGYSYVTLSDNASAYDAYKWEVKRINKDAEGNEIDGFFTETFNPVFDDKFINGVTFDFWYENPMSFDDETIDDKFKGYYKIGDTIVIKFSKMDKQVFNFLEKKYVQLSSAGNPFASPANVPSNIQGGALGLWAAYSPSFDTLICKP